MDQTTQTRTFPNIFQSLLTLQERIDALWGRDRILFFAVFFVMSMGFMVYGALAQLENINFWNNWVDQDAYIRYSIRLAETDGAYIGDHNRMPIYPWIQSLHYDSALSEDEYFARAKHVNIALTIPILLGILLIYTRFFSNFVAMNMFLLTTFMVYIFKAAYIQTELLYYALFFGVFLLMARMFVKPSFALAIITGAMIGIAHLTKASVLPGLALFIVFFAAKAVFQWRNWRHFAYLGLIVAMFLAVVWPYIRTSKEVFGHYFYNVNSTFYIWYDSWEEAVNGVRQHGDYVGWPDMPEDEIPSMQKYLSEKSVGEIVERVWLGVLETVRRHTYRGGYGYIWYVIALTLAAGYFAYRTYRSPHESAFLKLLWEYKFLIVFFLAFMIGHYLLYAFYVPIHPGQRFLLTLFLPYTFAMMWVMQQPIFEHLRVGEVTWFRAFNAWLFPILLVHSFLNAVYAAGVIHGGG